MQLRCEGGGENPDKQQKRKGCVKGVKNCGGKWGEKAKALFFIFLCRALIRQASVSWILMAGLGGEEVGRHNTLTWDHELGQ